MLKPDGRVIMISGANRGIGRAIAIELGRLGYRLSLGARDPDTLDNDAFGEEEDVFTHAYDATRVEDAQNWVQATLDHYGQLDGVVMNAGVLYPVGLMEGAEEELDVMWNVNFKGPLRLARAAMPALKASGQGRVVNVVSLAGKRVLRPESLGYSASKFAALALTHAIRQQGWDDGIRACAVCPGLVTTDMTSGVDAPAGQFKITAGTIAATVAYALALPNEASVAEILVNSRLELPM